MGWGGVYTPEEVKKPTGGGVLTPQEVISVKIPHVGGWGGRGLTRQKDSLLGLPQLHRTEARTEYLGYVHDGKPPDCIILFTIKDVDLYCIGHHLSMGPWGGLLLRAVILLTKS
jgi:hypothetical protein